MIALEVLLLVYFAAALLYWFWEAVCTFRMIRTVPVLADEEVPQPDRWPRLSVIVPACNEADSIESAMTSLLARDYPDLQIVLVNDRSTDATGEVIDRLAERDSRVRCVHVTELPDGWLGKVHAMHRALEHADGEFLLFTDADVHFRPAALRRAIAYCLAHRLDHLAGMPELWHSKVLVGAMIGASLRQLSMAMRFWAVNDPESSAYMGIGAFNLVRREAFAKTAGLEWLKMEVADDVGLGLMMKRGGGRCRLVNLRGYIGLHWYQTIGQMVHGAEKAFASVGRCSLWRCVVSCLVLLGLELGPLVALLPLGARDGSGTAAAWLTLPWLGPAVIGRAVLVWAALGAIAAFLVSTAMATRWSRHPFWPATLAPIGIVLLGAAFLRAGIVGFRRGGMVWRGTFYPSDQLVQGMHVKVGLIRGSDGNADCIRPESGVDSQARRDTQRCREATHTIGVDRDPPAAPERNHPPRTERTQP